MHKITEEEYLKYYVHSNEFFCPEDIAAPLPFVDLDLRFRQSNNELAAFSDKGECFAKYLYWKV